MKISSRKSRISVMIAFFALAFALLLPFPHAHAANNGSISGRVIDANTGRSLTGVYIICYPWGYKTRTAADGNYTLTDLPPETYKVTASLSGYHYAVIEDIMVSASGADQHRENINISLVTASTPIPDGFESDNTLAEAKEIWVDASISFLPAQVHNFHQGGDEDWVIFYALGTIASPKPYTMSTRNLGTNCDTVITLYDQSGAIIRGPVDDYWEGEDEELSWNCPAEGYYYIRISPGPGTTFGENTDYELSVFIPTGGIGSIVGTVRNGLSNRPVTGAKLTTDTGGVALSLEGSYVMVTPEGQCTVTGALEGYQPSSQSGVLVTDGEEATVNLSLMPLSPLNVSSLETNTTAPPALGQSLTLTFSASGEESPLYFKYWKASGYQTPDYGHWEVLKDWSSDNTLPWTPNSNDHYVIVAYITHDPGSGNYHQAGLSVETGENSLNPILIKNLTTTLNYPQSSGTPITFTATAFGGSGELYFKYWYCKGIGGPWNVIQEYSTLSSCTWTPTEDGFYTVVVWVTDDTSVSQPPIAGMTCTIGD